ncbi:MAG: hypothetical protein K2J93_02825 [Anaeroplasmataceae bacterium]|nr:hypothetical protein [Anaeroplasmataceae bacterium]
MNIKRWVLIGLTSITLIAILVLKYAFQNIPQWVIYVLLALVLILMVFYQLETTKEEQKKKEKAIEEEKDKRNELITILESKSEDSPTASVMYGILTKQILEIQSLIEQKNFEVNFDFNEEDCYYEVEISSKYEKKKEMYFMTLILDEKEEEKMIVFNNGDGIKTEGMKESEIIDIIIDNINKFQ